MELRTHPATSVQMLYDRDIYAWANENARLLQERRFDELDLTNLIDEVQDMARSEQRGILSHLKNLLMHLLKWEFQAELRNKSWSTSVVNARLEIEELIEESPSLRNAPAQDMAKAYSHARKLASKETGFPLSKFPAECPYTLEQVLDEDWLPA